MTRLLVAGALLASAPAFAQDQYRTFQLSDGREFTAIIEATESTGFRVRVPQGQMTVPFSQLYDMMPVTQAEYDVQEDWVIWLAAPAEREKGLIAAFEAVPHVRVSGGTKGIGPRIGPEQAEAAAACDQDMLCIAKAFEAAPWVWIVVARQEGADLVFETQTNLGTPRENPVRAGMLSAVEIGNAPWTILEVTEVKDPSSAITPIDPVKPVKPPKSADAAEARKMAWMPVPGMPSLARGDMGGFGLSLATALPASVLWVGAVGQNTQSVAGTALVGLGGYYAITVAVNHAVGLKGLDGAAVGVAPTAGGGGMITLTAAR